MMKNIVLSFIALSFIMLVPGNADAAIPLDFRLVGDGGDAFFYRVEPEVDSVTAGVPTTTGIIEANITSPGWWYRAGLEFTNSIPDLTDQVLTGHIGSDSAATLTAVFGVSLWTPGESAMSALLDVAPSSSGGTDFAIDLNSEFSGVALDSVDYIGLYVLDTGLDYPDPTMFTLENVQVVPEPSSLLLLGAGLAGLLVFVRQKKA